MMLTSNDHGLMELENYPSRRTFCHFVHCRSFLTKFQIPNYIMSMEDDPARAKHYSPDDKITKVAKMTCMYATNAHT